jgi:hypothetical protein
VLKAEAGGAWQSYLQRGNWRMIFPFSRRHQSRTAEELAAAIQGGRPPLAHLVCFPSLALNHAVFALLTRGRRRAASCLVYDPNRTDEPVRLSMIATRTFIFLPRTISRAASSTSTRYRGVLLDEHRNPAAAKTLLPDQRINLVTFCPATGSF